MDTAELLDTIEVMKARNTHLRDQTGVVAARAYNLLNEDVLEVLQRVVHALDRDKPKVGTALVHLRYVIEDVQKAIPHFKS